MAKRMSGINQEKFRVSVKKALLVRNQSITELAHKIGFSRNAVSIAVNQGRLKGVREAIQRELHV